jgi:DWNN domain
MYFEWGEHVLRKLRKLAQTQLTTNNVAQPRTTNISFALFFIPSKLFVCLYHFSSLFLIDIRAAMASSVFYKFRSQREESKVTFDGTGISVFDLKKEILLANNLGKATDFDLAMFDGSSGEGLFVSSLAQPCRSDRFVRRRVEGRLACDSEILFRCRETSASRPPWQGQSVHVYFDLRHVSDSRGKGYRPGGEHVMGVQGFHVQAV